MKKTIFPTSIIIFLIVLVIIFFGLVGGLVYIIRNPNINMIPALVEIKNETVPHNTYIAHEFNFEKSYDLYVNVTTDQNSAVLLLTESEFEKVQKDSNYMPNIFSSIKGTSAIVPVEAGKYSLMIIAGDQDLKYSLNVKAE